MKYVLILAVLAVTCHGVDAEKPQMEVAVVQINRLTSDLDYEKIRMLNLDKDTIEAVKKINAEQARLKKEIIDVADETKLMDIQKQIEFNSRKLSILRDRNSSNTREINVQKMATDFIVRKYSGRYSMILQDTNSMDGRIIYKNLKIVDINEEASDAFKKELAERVGEK
ncbi:MAG: hypothetical protein AAB263_10470 [Planctomycetota bacterium]